MFSVVGQEIHAFRFFTPIFSTHLILALNLLKRTLNLMLVD